MNEDNTGEIYAMKRFKFTSAEILSDLVKDINRRGWGNDLIWKQGNHPKQPLVVGRVNFAVGYLYIVLDTEMDDYPAHKVYGYIGNKYHFAPGAKNGLDGLVPVHAALKEREDSDHVWWVQFYDKETNFGVVLPMETVLLPVGNYELLKWSKI